MLFFAFGIAKTKIHITDFIFLDHLENVFWTHQGSPRGVQKSVGTNYIHFLFARSVPRPTLPSIQALSLDPPAKLHHFR